MLSFHEERKREKERKSGRERENWPEVTLEKKGSFPVGNEVIQEMKVSHVIAPSLFPCSSSLSSFSFLSLSLSSFKFSSHSFHPSAYYIYLNQGLNKCEIVFYFHLTRMCEFDERIFFSWRKRFCENGLCL